MAPSLIAFDGLEKGDGVAAICVSCVGLFLFAFGAGDGVVSARRRRQAEAGVLSDSRVKSTVAVRTGVVAVAVTEASVSTAESFFWRLSDAFLTSLMSGSCRSIQEVATSKRNW